MGVRGLTTFIAKYAERYLEPYELHDCDLVIDGDSLACNLFKDVSRCNSAFGGDYDRYYRTIIEFFQLLRDCNIRPFVLLDGGYEAKKMRTVAQRLRTKIAVIKHLNPMNSKPIFPLMMKEVFIDAVRDCGVPLMRCLFEADDEIASLARKLNCPVLSYDSDFYIFNVKYIPFITLTLKVHTRKVGHKSKDRRLMRKCEARQLYKRTKRHEVGGQIETDTKETKGVKTIKFLDCCLYRIENLAGKTLDPEMLPLFAALIGNDYIDPSTFNSFFSQIAMSGVSKKIPRQQKRVQGILNWLRKEKKETALEKVMTRMKKRQREYLLEQMKNATEGYRNEKSEAFNYFEIELSESSASSDGESDEEEQSSEEEDISEEESCGEELSEEVEDELSEEVEDELSEGVEDELSEGVEDELSEEVEDEQPEELAINKEDKFPEWFRESFRKGYLPRFFVDLLHLKVYINNPTIEHFPFTDCNSLALPIFNHIYGLLYYPDDIPEIKYITRCVRVTNVRYTKMVPAILPTKPLLPNVEDSDQLKVVFERIRCVDEERLFSKIQELPSDLRLYVLSLVYTIHRSHHFDMVHIHSLLVCLVVLRTIDSKIDPIREPKEFKKKFGKTIQKEKLAREKDSYVKKVDKVLAAQKDMSPLEKVECISKVECMLVQETLLKFFNLKEIFKKKHDDFSTTILHGFSEFQCSLYNMYALNALVNQPLEQPKMSNLFCGMFLYNIYGTINGRDDLNYYVKNHLFYYSKTLGEFYEYLWSWLHEFIPTRIGESVNKTKNHKVTDNPLKAAGVDDMLDEDDSLNIEFTKLKV